jgi:hypothetical protein
MEYKEVKNRNPDALRGYLVFHVNITSFWRGSKVPICCRYQRFEMFKFAHNRCRSSALLKKILVLLLVVFFLFSHTLYAESDIIKTRCHGTFK